MALVARVDFGSLSVRVSIVDSERGLLSSAIAEYPLGRGVKPRAHKVSRWPNWIAKKDLGHW